MNCGNSISMTNVFESVTTAVLTGMQECTATSYKSLQKITLVFIQLELSIAVNFDLIVGKSG